jgi:glycolate oxidase
VCTIGGNVAFNSGGAHCLKYGMTSNHILALEVVLPTGELFRIGDRSAEAVGADEVGLFVGSEGLFGVATEITVRLLPLPERVFTLLASYSSLESAGDAVSAVIASGLLPGAMEIMDRLAIEAAEAAVSAGYPRDAAALLIVELEGDAAQVDAEADELERVIAGTEPDETRCAEDALDRARIWKGRKGAFSAVGRLSPDYLVQDGVVPRSRLGEALAKVEESSRRHGLRVANVFHAGDGNLHPLILYDGRVEGELERAEELAGELLQMCVDLGGSITGEHGVGMEKREYLPQMYGEADLDVMKRLRAAIDPGHISNRGKMFPDAEAPALVSRGPHPLERAGILSRE